MKLGCQSTEIQHFMILCVLTSFSLHFLPDILLDSQINQPQKHEEAEFAAWELDILDVTGLKTQNGQQHCVTEQSLYAKPQAIC